MDKYGLHVRLVNGSDAEFILKLRTDSKLSRYLHSTDSDLSKQVEWIMNYKNRELQGIDYYFIYSQNNNFIGLNRIYNIKDKEATSGSWICQQGLDVDLVISTLLLERDILFEHLNKDFDVFDVRKKNYQVIRTHKMMGAKIIGETDLDYLFQLDKNSYFKKKIYIIDLLNLKNN